MKRNNNNVTSNSRQRTAHSTSSASPINSVSPQGRLGKFIESLRKKNENEVTSISNISWKGNLCVNTNWACHEWSSQIIHSFTPNSRIKEYKKEVFELEEDIADAEYRHQMPQLLNSKTYTAAEEVKLRENLICKIKKVCDEFNLSDDTFFRTVFLYDFQERYKIDPNVPRYTTMKVWLDEIFTFGETPDNNERQKQYMCFFEIITCLMVAMKYYDFELETPTLRHILKYYKVGKMNFTSKDESLDSEKIRDIQEIVFETVYEYVCERQMDLLYRINWKIPMINIKHFIDHYKRILPVFDKKNEEGSPELTRLSRYFSLDQSAHSELTSVGMQDMFKTWRNEILEWIDAIAKLWPLIPEFINYKCKELATAALVVSIKHSLKCLPEEMQKERKKIDQIRMLYSKWIQSLFISYNIDKESIKSLVKKIKVFLDRVCA